MQQHQRNYTGAKVGVSDGGPELHVGRALPFKLVLAPEHAGYTQAEESEAKGVVPNVIPAQLFMTTILRPVQP